MKQENYEDNVPRCNAGAPSASVLSQGLSVEQGSKGSEKGGRGSKSSEQEERVDANHTLGPFHRSSGPPIVPGPPYQVSEELPTCSSSDNKERLTFTKMDGDKRGRRRSSRKSRGIVEAIVESSGTSCSGEASEATLQKPCLNKFPSSPSVFSPYPDSTNVSGMGIERYASLACSPSGMRECHDATHRTPGPDVRLEALPRWCSPVSSSSPKRAESICRLQYVPVRKLNCKAKGMPVLRVSKPKDCGKLLTSSSKPCSWKGDWISNFITTGALSVESSLESLSSPHLQGILCVKAFLGSSTGIAPDNDKYTKGSNGVCSEVESVGDHSELSSTVVENSYGTAFWPAYGHSNAKETFFTSHWSSEQVRASILAGQVYKANFRVNAYNRTEAYVTVPGVPVDIRIDGVTAQNRAIEGDIVAVEVDPPAYWAKLKVPIAKQLPVELGMQEERSEFESSRSDQSEVSVSSLEKTGKQIPGDRAVNIELDQDNKCLLVQMEQVARERRPEQGESSQPEVQKALISNCSPAGTQRLAEQVILSAGKRPTGKVVAILEKSPRREAIVGSLDIHQSQRSASRSGLKSFCKVEEQQAQKNCHPHDIPNSILLTPADTRLPKMVVYVNTLPAEVLRRVQAGDPTLRHELFAARIESWKPECPMPRAAVRQSLGNEGDIETHTAAILFEHAIHGKDFPSHAMACLPSLPYEIPYDEIQRRRDLRGTRVFSIDPPTAKDLDDALSIEQLADGNVRVGVHIADVSYFVRPNSALDKEAQRRSTSVYLVHQVLPMLPKRLCEELCSLDSGVDRLAFSVMWQVGPTGVILDQWIGRTVIRSCAKLTYAHAQAMIDGNFNVDDARVENLPILHGSFTWQEVVSDVLGLNKVAKYRRHSRFVAGALRLDNSKLVFSLDAKGIPCDSMVYEQTDSNFLVEEMMLMANMAVARVISNAFPDCALLRRHPEPNPRKLQEFEEVCLRHGFKLDSSSAGALHSSLERIRLAVKDDPVLFNVLMLYATKPMQLAKYFSTGEFKDNEDEWAHYALATPYYTHFTSPIRRYPDLVVHRTLAAVLDAEAMLSQAAPLTNDVTNGSEVASLPGLSPLGLGSFSGGGLQKEAASSLVARIALDEAASKHKIPGSSELAVVAAHCNERKLAGRNVAEACAKVYLWAMLKNKQGTDLVSEARVVALGPKFMSVYVNKIAMERRIYYEEIDGMSVEWFEGTGTVVLDICSQRRVQKKQNPCKNRVSRSVADVATLVNPTRAALRPEDLQDVVREVEDILAGRLPLRGQENGYLTDNEREDKSVWIEPAVLPLTLKLFSTVPVSLHPTGGNNKPVDVSARLYVSSYQTSIG